MFKTIAGSLVILNLLASMSVAQVPLNRKECDKVAGQWTDKGCVVVKRQGYKPPARQTPQRTDGTGIR